MESLDLLRETRPTPDAPSAQATIDARAALMSAIFAEESSVAAAAGSTARSTARGSVTAPRRRRRWLGWGLAAGATALAAGALVVTQTLLPVGTPGAPVSAAAAVVLNQAANSAAQFRDPVLQPGQYLKVSRKSRNVAESEVAGANAQGVMVRYLQGEDSDKYIPAERSDVWVWVRRATGPIAPVGATTPEQFAQLQRASEEQVGAVDYVSAAQGRFYESSGQPAEVTPGQEAPSDLPTTPEALLQHIYTVTEGSGQARDRQAFVWIADRLGTDLPPAALRALYFRTLALIPGTEVGETDAELNGVRGTLVTAPGTQHGDQWQILIDPASGRYLGEREVGGFDYPDDFVSSSKTVTTTVVDSVPNKPSTNRN